MAISGGDGSIILDTKVDTKGLNSGLNSMKSAITKIGGLLAAAFSVKMLINFAKESKNLYKIQMQNEVKLATVMRQRMKATDDEIKSMLELASAQQQIGIIGDEVQLAGLQQVATFATQKETIETLLPAMNNLIAQQYGYEASTESARNVANLMGKVLQGQVGALTRVGITFSAAEEQMLKTGNEMERAAVLAQVITNNVGEMNSALAQTDVGRQQQLANTWGDIKEQFGAAFQQIAIIALPALNAVAKALAWVANIARMVAQTVANMFGMKTSGGGGNQNAGIGGMATSTEEAAEGMSNLGNATEKAGKQAKKSTASFDDLQILTESAASSAESATEEMGNIASGIGGDVGTGFDFGIQADVDTAPLEIALGRIKGFLEPIQKIFMSGFWQGFENADFTGIEQSINGIKESLSGIFTSPEVQTSAQGFDASVALAFGQITGSIASIGTTIATNLFGGFDQYLQENEPFIKEKVSGIFDASSQIATSVGNMWSAFANIFSVFASENGQSLTANIISIFSNARLGITELALQIGADFINFLTQPIVENQEVLKTALDGILGVFSEITGSISSLVSDLFTGITALYDEHIKPLVDTITEVITNLVGKITEAFNTYILPVLQGFAEDFGVVVEEHIKPMFDKIFGFIGKVVDLVKPLIENVIQPLLTFLIDTFAPVIGGIFDTVGKIFNTLIATVSDVIGGIMDVFSGLIDFFVGIFTGDLEKAWEGLKTTFSGLFDGITSILKGALNVFIDVINGLITGINAAIGVINAIPGVNIPEIKKIPRLAQGTVVPPNREFLAVLGDNKKEHEIVSPLSTMKQAFTEAMIEMGGNFGGGNTEVVLEIDGREFGRAVVEQGNRENRRIGTRLVIA